MKLRSIRMLWLVAVSLIAFWPITSSAQLAGVAGNLANVSTGFWDGTATAIPFCRVSETGTGPVAAGCVATDSSSETVYPPPDNLPVSVTSVGSSVTEAHASGGSVGASVYNGYVVGTDTYYGYADARTSDLLQISGNPNSTATVAVGAIVNGGLGIYGSDAGANATARFNFSGQSAIVGERLIFRDEAMGEQLYDMDGNPLAPVHHYNYGVRNDYRYVDVLLDGNGDGELWVELVLSLEANEGGDFNLYESASAADYGNTINALFQPMQEGVNLVSTAGWDVRAFGSFMESSPDPTTLTNEQLGIVPEPGTFLLLGGGLGLLAFYKPRE